MSRYPYDRFVYFAPARGLVERVQSAWFSLQYPVSRRLLDLKWRLIGWWNRDKYNPLTSFDPQTGRPVLADVPESAHRCRTRHGRATIVWSIDWPGGTRQAEVSRVRNVLIATGERIEVAQPRRPDHSGDGWIWGRFKITADDVALIDDPAVRPKYDPDPEATRLEKLLAKSPRFRAAVADPHGARVAFLLLSNLEWFNIADREELPFFSGGSIAGMIAGVRDRGETYMDYKFGTNTQGIPQADIHRYSLEMHDIMRELGWRTHTAEELQLQARANFNSRVEERITNWNSLTELEARSADSCDSTGCRYAELPMLIYEGEEVWAEQLPQHTRLMMSEEYARRVRHLIATSRISDDEYRVLTGLW